MYADILILNTNSNHDQVLTYSIPSSLGKFMAGTLVSVEVRKKICQGLVIRINEKRPDIKNIKSILNVIYKTPVLSKQSLSLAFWLHDYYVCSLNRVVQLFLPPPVRMKEKRVLTVVPFKDTHSLFLEEKEERIIKYIEENIGEIDYNHIKKIYSDKELQILEYLIKMGYLRLETVFEPVVRKKTQKVLYLKKNTLSIEDLKKRAPRQAQVLEEIKEGPKALRELKEKICNIYSVLKPLQDKGWVEVKEEIIRRNPYQDVLKVKRPENLNAYQRNAITTINEAIEQSIHEKFLLFGVTGSGKTEVYLKAIEKVLANNRQALYMVPEISLTPQVVSLITKTFGDKAAILHSAMSAGERSDEWMRIKDLDAKIVVGPRSALFAPFSNLGLIIIDEEHENTYKQSEPAPRYDARIVAEKLSQMHSAVLLSGSATPSLRTYMLTENIYENEKYEMLRLPKRVAERPMPEISIIDMRKMKNDGQSQILSEKMITALKETIERKEQAILFINRRGFHTYIFCRECGKPLTCPNCAVSFTYHRTEGKMVCHYCNYQRSMVEKCPYCGSHYLGHMGTGTERAVHELKINFPDITILRMDADTTKKKNSHLNILKQFQDNKAQILVGTQMVAKGLDFPSVTLVGVLNADNLLNMPDFQSSVRTYQLISQVSGRAGRGEKPGKVYIQTHQAEHYLFSALINRDYDDFFEREMYNRNQLQYPPYHKLARIMVSGDKEEIVKYRIDYLKELLKIEIEKESLKDVVEILGPTPAPISIIKNRYRYHLLIKSPLINVLQSLAFKIYRRGNNKDDIRIIIDIEPQNLL